MRQAQRECVDILVVPLRENFGPTRQSYETTVLAALKPLRIQCLAFGDLHLRDLRKWREQAFSAEYSLKFPVFDVPYTDLISRLKVETAPETGRVTIRVSSVSPELIGKYPKGLLEVGLVYDEAFIAGLPDGIDVMGENGEFHTHVYHNDETRESGDESCSSTGSEGDNDGSDSESACFTSD